MYQWNYIKNYFDPVIQIFQISCFYQSSVFPEKKKKSDSYHSLNSWTWKSSIKYLSFVFQLKQN